MTRLPKKVGSDAASGLPAHRLSPNTLHLQHGQPQVDRRPHHDTRQHHQHTCIAIRENSAVSTCSCAVGAHTASRLAWTAISNKHDQKRELTLVQYPQRGEDVTISLLEEERHSVAADQGHAVLALGDRHIALLREDVLEIGLGEVRVRAGANRPRVRAQGTHYDPRRCAGRCKPRGICWIRKSRLVRGSLFFCCGGCCGQERWFSF